MNATAELTQTLQTDIRVGRRIHCRLYGGKDGTISKVTCQPGLGNAKAMLGGAVMIGSGEEAYIDVVWDNGSVSRRVPECIATGVQWHFLDEADHSSEQIDKAFEFACQEAARVEAEKETEKKAFAASVERIRNDQEFAHINPLPESVTYRDLLTFTAKNVRKHLKHRFPGVKFSVRQRTGDGLLVTWSREVESEVVNQRTVTDAVSLFKTGRYNAYEDYHDSKSSPFNAVFGGSDFIFCQPTI